MPGIAFSLFRTRSILRSGPTVSLACYRLVVAPFTRVLTGLEYFSAPFLFALSPQHTKTILIYVYTWHWSTVQRTRLLLLKQQQCWLLVTRLTSQQQASVSQGPICTDNFTYCHTEIEDADQTFYLTQSQYTDTGPDQSLTLTPALPRLRVQI